MPELEYDSRNRNVVCRVVLFGTYFLITSIGVLLWISFSMGNNPQGLSRVIVCAIALLYMVIAHVLLRKNFHRSVAYMLLFFYTLLAGSIVWTWGINTPLGTLILGLVIVLAGILLSARHSFFAAIVASMVLTFVQLANQLDWHKPSVWTSEQSSFGDVVAYSTVFGMLALVSWLYNREMERSLAQAKQAEVALLLQKASLEQQVQKRTLQLRRAQLEEMQQMYRFTELGQLGITLLHDLANHLTALTLEIDELQSKQHSKDITRVRRITGYLGKIVDSTRERLRGGTKKRTFNVAQKITEVTAFLRYRAQKAGMIIDWQPPTGVWKCTGDPDSLCQVIAILTSNAIDAGSGQKSDDPHANQVAVTLQRDNAHTILRISDWGKGIAKADRKKLFKPFHSAKRSGLGLGLYIAKQTVEMEFGGTLEIDPISNHTEFIVKLPRSNGK